MNLYSFFLSIPLCYYVAQCDVNRTTTYVNMTSSEGEYYVIGLFSMYDSHSDGEFDDKAIRLYIKLRYFIGRQISMSRLYNGTSIGFVAFDVGRQHDTLVTTLTDILLGKKFKPGRGLLRRRNETGEWFCECLRKSRSSNILSIVSYIPNDMTKLAAGVVSADGIPFFAYTEQELVAPFERAYHLLFTSYGLINIEVNKMMTRINASMRDPQNKLVILVNLISDTNKISTFHVSELLKMLREKNHCIAIYTPASLDKFSMATLVRELKESVTMTAGVVWIDWNERDEFIMELERQQVYNKTWYIYSEQAFVNGADNKFNVSAATVRDLYIVFLPVYSYQSLNVRFTYKGLKNEVYRDVYREILDDPWIGSYLKHKNLSWSPLPFQHLDTHDTLEKDIIESMLLPLWWLQPFLRLKKMNLDTVHGLLSYLSAAKLYRARAMYARPVNNGTAKDRDGMMIKDVRCDLPECPAGLQPLFTMYSPPSPSFWHRVNAFKCLPCAHGHFKESFNNRTCMPCGDNLLSSFDRTTCFNPYKEFFINKQSMMGKIIIGFVTFGLFINLMIIVIFIAFRNTPTIRSTSLFTSLAQLFLHALTFLGVPLLFIGKPRIALCAAQPMVFGFLLTLITALCIKKSQQLLSALKADKTRSRGKSFISEATECFVLFLLHLTQIVVGAVCLVIIRPRVVVQRDSERFLFKLSCNTELHLDVQLCYVLLLSMYCVSQGVRARTLPKYFNDTANSALSMLISVVILSVKFPVAEVFTSGVTRTFVNSIVVCLVNLVHVMVMFVPKVYTVVVLTRHNRFRSMFRTSNTSYCVSYNNKE